ncbi:Hypothetical predicted protein [Marmota monax]|uniref:Uncharacterized protein n=1 Tax=Marmota monax TaxID=9995 RepID=A0A5E4C514_MARMO|nr:hypothetical protein GHT09_006826 [Marmota monax]VTJ77017.1 Hypothetical predicted protein [Marmota monax]
MSHRRENLAVMMREQPLRAFRVEVVGLAQEPGVSEVETPTLPVAGNWLYCFSAQGCPQSLAPLILRGSASEAGEEALLGAPVAGPGGAPQTSPRGPEVQRELPGGAWFRPGLLTGDVWTESWPKEDRTPGEGCRSAYVRPVPAGR